MISSRMGCEQIITPAGPVLKRVTFPGEEKMVGLPKYAPDAPGKPLGCTPVRGPSTYLHAGPAGVRHGNVGGIVGWPVDHSAEDTFAVPPRPVHAEDREYKAEFGTDGSARLVLIITTSVAKFDTFADAQLAAKALNESQGL